MTIICNDKVGVGSNRAVHEFVVVRVNGNQVPKKVFGHLNHIGRGFQNLQNVISDGRARCIFFSQFLCILIQNISRQAKEKPPPRKASKMG